MPTEKLRHPSLRALGLLLYFSGLVAVCWAELFKNPEATGFGDYQFFHHSWEAARVAWYEEGQAPLWNPFQCGGIPDWADPQAQFFHPLFALTGAIGTTLALKVFLCVHALLGCFGMYHLARLEGLKWFGAVAAATTWIGSGFFAWHCGTGHGNFIAFYLAPWVLYCWRRAVVNIRYAALLAFVLSAVAFAGGAYAFPFFGLLLAFEASLQLVRPGHDRGAREGVLIAGAVTLLLTLTLCALRLLPILEHLAYYPRLVNGNDSIQLKEFLQMLTRGDVRGPGMPFGGHLWSWTEYGSYIGYPAVLLGIFGVGRALFMRTHGRLLIGAGLFAALTFGHFGLLSPWTLLHQLPVFDALRVPTRFVVIFLLYFALFLGGALDSLRARPARGPRAWSNAGPFSWLRVAGPWFCLLWLATSLVQHHRFILDGMWRDKPVRVDANGRAEEFFIGVLPKQGQPYAQHPAPPQLPSANQGTGFCYTGMAYRPAPGLWAGAGPQVRVPRGASLESWGKSTRSVWAVVVLPQPGRIIFNQTYAPGWVAASGELTLDRGRVAVDLPAGRHRVEVEYRPVLFPWAIAGSSLGAVLALVIALLGHRVRRRRPRRILTLVCLGCAAMISIAYARAPSWAYAAQVPKAFQPKGK